jgi:hypothetical protein
MPLREAIFARGAQLASLGIKPLVALHVAAAESMQADVVLSCDDRLCAKARRHRSELRVRVMNPLDWIREQGYEPNAG